MLRAAYRSLSKKYHPDSNPDSDEAKHFQQVQEAGEVLSDPQKRRHYDEHLRKSARSAAESTGTRRHSANGGTEPPPFVISEFFGNPDTRVHAPENSLNGVCLIEKHYRLLWTDHGGYMLLRHSDDGDLEMDVTDKPEEAERLACMRTSLDTWRESVPTRDAEGGRVMDPDWIRALQEIGYLEEAPKSGKENEDEGE